MEHFLNLWAESTKITLGLFWMAFWAFGLGYVVSSMIQVFVTEKRMKETMGEAGVKSVALGTFFGFISSSCSFAALSTTRALFSKGAGLIPSLAFLLASTNLVVELGIIISLFLSWQFVVGEYLGGLLLIVLMAFLVKVTLPKKLSEEARKNAKEQEGGDDFEGASSSNWKTLIKSKKGWKRVSEHYIMEWLMVWKDVSIGFTVAGVIAAFVPQTFFESLFLGAGSANPSFFEVLFQSFVGPVAAFFTFIGSMGNIPLAAVLFSNGVSFAGIMAFIFSDLVVFPVLRIQAKYYGWKMALYILSVFLMILIGSSLIMHYGFSFFEVLPDPSSSKEVNDREFFKIDYTFYLNLLFAFLTFVAIRFYFKDTGSSHDHSKVSLGEKVLMFFTGLSYLWLIGGGVLNLYL